ncbi:MAG: PRC-barrel domain-containing protein [Candidatus Aenigmarchaeota archaeon]|nr:PRC-barrel domain-containing protein [Candidatus Aenigmarchaeota archaeon]
MPITTKSVMDLFDKDVFTTRGYYCGRVSDVELDLSRYKVRAVVVQVARGTFLERALGGKKGIVVPYSLVQAIGDIVIIKHEMGIEKPIEGEAAEVE